MPNNYQKQTILRNFRTIPEHSLKNAVNNGIVTIDELEQEGLDSAIIEKWRSQEISQNTTVKNEVIKEDILRRIVNNDISISEIRRALRDNQISIEDLRSSGIGVKTAETVEKLCLESRETIFTTIDQLPPMEDGRSDIYFVGLAGTGKSTMLAGLLTSAVKRGILMEETYSYDGARYKNQMLRDLRNGMLPEGTASGSYNYIAISVNDEDDKKHPFNVVEVPGEMYKDILDGNDVSAFLGHINNKNRKVLIFTLDPMEEEGEFGSNYDQNTVYTTILSMFRREGVLDYVDAIYFVINKFDYVRKKIYPGDTRSDAIMANDYFKENFLHLLNNAKEARNSINKNMRITAFPYSIGTLLFSQVLESYEQSYSDNLLNNLLEDTFIIKGKKKKRFFGA